ncbi:MAG: hypothetical protein LAQ30_07610 [Acidobacteriia bacterium]|nr:hypothetical protein [Terriglobia bacterium]
MKPVNLTAVFSRFSGHWSPKVLGDINDMQIKAVKLQGEFVWHHHDEEDELFLVHKGRLLIRFAARSAHPQVNPRPMPANSRTLAPAVIE